MSADEITCRGVLDFLGAYLDGELVPGVRADFERHLARCPACVDYLESYRETIRLGRAAYDQDGPVPKEVPEGLIEAILASKRERSSALSPTRSRASGRRSGGSPGVLSGSRCGRRRPPRADP